MPISVEKSIKKLGSKSAGSRRSAVEALTQAGLKNRGLIPQIMPGLIKGVSDQDDGVARRAGFGIYQFTQTHTDLMKDQIGALNQGLTFALNQGGNPNFDSYNPFVSIVNSYSIIAERYPENLYSSIPLLNKCVNYPVYHPENPHWGLDQLYASAIRTLGLIGVKRPDLVKPSVIFITRCLSDSFKYTFFLNQDHNDPNSLRYCVAKALDGIGLASPPIVVTLLIKGLNDISKQYANYCKTLLNRLFDAKAASVIPSTILVFADESLQIQEMARQMTEEWGKRAPQLLVPALINCFQNPSDAIRMNAANVLGEIGKTNPNSLQNVLPRMVQVLTQDQQKDVRQNMADALFKIAEVNPDFLKPYSQGIIPALKDTYHHVRWRTAQIVGLIGNKDAFSVREGLPILMEMYRDPHEHVRWRAEEAVNMIGIDKSEYLMAMKSIQQVKTLLEENKKKGIAGTEEEELIQNAKEEFQDMRYKDSVSITDQAKVIIVNAMKDYKQRGRPTHIQAGQTLQAVEEVMADPYNDPMDEEDMPVAEPVPLDQDHKFCPACGTKNLADANFCMNCRKEIPEL